MALWFRFWAACATRERIQRATMTAAIATISPASARSMPARWIDQTFDIGIDLRVEAYRKRYRSLSPRFESMFDPLALFPEAEYDCVMIDPTSARRMA